MGGEGWRAIATSAIWVSIATILAFGLYRMNGGSQEWLFFMTALILGGGLVGTLIVWTARSPVEKESKLRGFDVMPAESAATKA